MNAGAVLLNDNVQSHSKDNEGIYDVLCMFQVLEHLVPIKEVIQSCLKCLKQGGFLVISVPNNDSFIKKDKLNLLNLPPHHMGRWNEKSLKALGKLFKMKLVESSKEPLQANHFDWFVNIQINYWIKSDILKKVIYYFNIDSSSKDL